MRRPSLRILLSLLPTFYFLHSVFAAEGAITLPPPYPMTFDTPPPIVTQGKSLIGKIDLSQKTVLPALEYTKPFGPEYTLTFWVKLDKDPLLNATGFSADNPVTLVFLDALKRDTQGTAIRVENGNLMAYEILPNGKWSILFTMFIKITPDQWHLVAYTRSAKQGRLFLDGVAIAQTRDNFGPQDQLQKITFGSFQNNRRMQGLILHPRLYPVALTYDQIQAIQTARPPEAK